MYKLTSQEIDIVNGGTYGFCEGVRDATVGGFTAAGSIIGGATTFGFGAVAGGFVGHMFGNWVGDIVYHDCK